MVRTIATAFMMSTVLWSVTTAQGSDGSLPRVAQWYGDRTAAASLRFDDGLESHVTTVIPLLNRYGIRATFLVNPGLDRYQEHRDFWEKQVPAMGHRLGDHTMHHRGAQDLADADYEIGEAARTIWRAYPRESKLLVFASGGGGKLWGGKLWEQAAPEYHALVKKYHLVDLYDGTHPYLSVRTGMGAEDLCSRLDRAAERHLYQVFAFHEIGTPSISESIKSMVRGYGLDMDEKEFEGFVRCLNDRKERIWIAPLIDVYKYEQEARATSVRVVRGDRRESALAVTVGTDPELYDHALTLVLPRQPGRQIRNVRQAGATLTVYQNGEGADLVDILPKNSTVVITYGGA
jgi:peptidoglycan/xylan/chitin deacetylase (PgdA/CDA1 family)